MTAKNPIRPLPERVINKIAAGEVIERPAAVVKELVENSIDAGADRIEIIIEKSGTRLIKIVDNGHGIEENQVEIAFSRHATSKISSFDDLNNLYSYGFRGEALPSIASISRMRMVTRTGDARLGTEIIYEGGVLKSRQPVSAPPGTTVEVENLFYNTPARRKFLKSESTEARHISRTAMALALGRSGVGFTYSLNGRKVFTVAPEEDMKSRVARILGEGQKYVQVEGETELVRVTGYVGTPGNVQNNRYGQFIFINNRYIHSPSLSHAFVAGYGELIPRGTFPVGALLLNVDASEVDVNVHPTKAEVRLSHEREVHDALFRIVRDSLQQDGIVPAVSGKPAATTPGRGGTGRGVGPGQPTSGYVPGVYQSADSDPQLLSELYRGAAGGISGPDHVTVDRKTGEVLEPEDHIEPIRDTAGGSSDFRVIGRLASLYLLLQIGDDLYVVDQHTAHERVLYEETLAQIERSAVDAQTLLFPAQMDLNPEQFVIFEETAELLNASGFKVSAFGGRTVNIEAIPSVLSGKAPEEAFIRVLDDLSSDRRAGHDLKKTAAQSIACRSAVMAGDKLSDQEAAHLVTRLLSCENRYSCPHGRPTFVKISRQDLDKQFGRA